MFNTQQVIASMEAFELLYQYQWILFIYGVITFSLILSLINNGIIPKSMFFALWLTLAFVVNFLEFWHILLTVFLSLLFLLLYNWMSVNAAEKNAELLDSERHIYVTRPSQIMPPASYSFIRSFILIPQNFLDLLNEEELEALIKHEEAHIAHRHMAKKLFFSSFLLILNLFFQFFCSAWLVVLPFFTLFLIMILLSSISKRFEFEADRYASDSTSAFESMLRKVESVFPRKRVFILELLYGYIPVEERIERLNSS